MSNPWQAVLYICHICIFSSPIFHLGLQFGDIPPFSVGEGDLINVGGGGGGGNT